MFRASCPLAAACRPPESLVIGDSVHDPAPAVGGWEEGHVAYNVPEQAPCCIRQPCDGIPGCHGWRMYPKPEPTVPGEVLQFHCAHKERRIEPSVRVVCQVFDPSGELGVDVFVP